MYAVKGIFDGQKVMAIDPIPVQSGSENIFYII